MICADAPHKAAEGAEKIYQEADKEVIPAVFLGFLIMFSL